MKLLFLSLIFAVDATAAAGPAVCPSAVRKVGVLLKGVCRQYVDRGIGPCKAGVAAEVKTVTGITGALVYVCARRSAAEAMFVKPTNARAAVKIYFVPPQYCCKRYF